MATDLDAYVRGSCADREQWRRPGPHHEISRPMAWYHPVADLGSPISDEDHLPRLTSH